MMKKIFTFATATMIPIAAFAISNKRLFQIGSDFLQYELLSHAKILALFVIVVAVGLAGFYFGRAYLGFISLFIHSLRRIIYRRIWIPAAFLAIIAVCFVPYTAERYRLFSEASYQERAIHALEAGNIKKAMDLCQRYLDLYPQRRRNGAVPDRICLAIVDFTKAMGRLHDFVQEQRPEDERFGKILVPSCEGAREEALTNLAALAGRSGLILQVSSEKRGIPATAWSE